MRIRTALLLVGLVFRLASAHAGDMPLFNGRDLTGFYTWLVDTQSRDPRSVFTVTNGQIRISGDGLGYLATHRSFTNYHLTIEFRWGSSNTRWGDRIGRARDSGLFLHATGPNGNSHDGQGAFMAAIECNIFQGATGDFLLIRGNAADGTLIAPSVTARVAPGKDKDGWFTWDPAGAPQTITRWGRVNWRDKDPSWIDQTDFRGRRDVEKPPGDWNSLEVRSREGEIEIWLNDVLVNHVADASPRSGRILLQCEGSEIFFRNLRLREQ